MVDGDDGFLLCHFDAPLHVQDELVLILFEHPDAEAQAQRGAEERNQHHVGGQPLAPHDAGTHGGDVPVDGVQVDDVLHPAFHLARVVEDGAAVDKQCAKDLPDVHDVTHKNVERGQNQPDAQTENKQHHKGINGQQHSPDRDVRPGQQRDDKQCHETEKEVDERKAALFQREDVFGNIDLAQQRAVLQHALHGHGRALAEEVEHQLADDKEQREVLDALTALVEQRTEHGPHDQTGQQRVQHAPRHAQHAAAVFQLEIAGNQVLQQVAVFPETREGVFQVLHDVSLWLSWNLNNFRYIAWYRLLKSRGDVVYLADLPLRPLSIPFMI